MYQKFQNKCRFGAIFSYLTLQWRHYGRDGVSNHQPHDCLLNRLFRRRSKKTSKLRVTGFCAGNWPMTGEFPAQMASNAENVSIWWRHHEMTSSGQQRWFETIESHNAVYWNGPESIALGTGHWRVYLKLAAYIMTCFFANQINQIWHQHKFRQTVAPQKLEQVSDGEGNLDNDDVIKWKYFPRNWSFVRGIHRSPVNSPHKGQWRGALMISSICAWINDWVNNREAGDLRRNCVHYDVIVMISMNLSLNKGG